MDALAAVALWLHAQLLRLYPRRFRRQFGDEMSGVFRQAVHNSAARGPQSLLLLLAREFRDWPLSCLRQHLYERNRHVPEPHLPPISGWGAVAAVVPFLLTFFLYFFSASGAFLLLPAILLGGVVVAWFRRWPGWIASWLGALILVAQNWLPGIILGPNYDNNPAPSLAAFLLANVILPIFWFFLMYLVVRHWPRHGVLVFLAFLTLPWAFSMEFASQAMSALVYGGSILFLALFALAISLQRTISGDVWLLYLAAVVPGAVITLGAVFYSPGMENAWRLVGANVLEALAPFAALLLLHAFRAWAAENRPVAWRAANMITGGFLASFTALLALPRLLGPSYFDHLHISITSALTVLWSLGVILMLWGVWRLRAYTSPLDRPRLAHIALFLFAIPFLQRSSSLFHIVNSLTYRQPGLSFLRDRLPVFSTANSIILIAGVGSLLLLPFTVAALRRHTVAFPRYSIAARPTRFPFTSRRARIAALLTLGLFSAGGAFFAFIFFPLQREAAPFTSTVALGDVDADGDLDAVLANTRRLVPTADNHLLFNDGSGAFTVAAATMGQGASGAILVDYNDDGRLDVVFGGMGGVWLYSNEGARFRTGEVMGMPAPPAHGASQYNLDAGDLNGDGFPDVFLAGCCGFGVSNFAEPNYWIPAANRVLFGDDSGLTDSGQSLGDRGSQAVTLGDLDGDGDLDAFVGNTQSNGEDVQNDEPNEVWLNDGDGFFSDSGQAIGRQRTYATSLGDVDGDGDLDALVGNEGSDELWLNDGLGRFTLGAQRWSDRRTLQVFLVDLDGDGDLDAVTAHELSTSFAWYRHALIWWNDGSGAFKQDRARIRYGPNAALAIGDVTGDGVPNILSAALDTMTIHTP